LNKRCLFAKGLQWKKLSIGSCDSLAWQCNTTQCTSDTKHFVVFSLATSGLSALLFGPLKQDLRCWLHNKEEVEMTVSGCKCKNSNWNRIFNLMPRQKKMYQCGRGLCWKIMIL
jgi:hypothetical protein